MHAITTGALRTELTEWVDELGQRPMLLRGEASAHQDALWRHDVTGPH